MNRVVERKSAPSVARRRRVRAAVNHGVEVGFTEQTVVASLTELVAGDQLTATDDTLEAFDVVDLVPGSHHQVVLGKRHAALGATSSEKSDTNNDDCGF